jgi:hypothetical protein
MGTCAVSLYTYVHGQQINAGKEAVGKVYLFVKEGINAATLNLKICGIEKTEVSYDDMVSIGNDSRPSMRKASEKHTFLDVENMLAAFEPQTIGKGQYEFPFSFTIPKGVPSSMMVVTGFQDKCSVVYTVEAVLKDATGTVISRSKRILTLVDDSHECATVPQYFGPARSPLVSACCVSNGDVLLVGCTTASILSTANEVTVKFATKHAPDVRVNYVEVSLREHVTFQANGIHGKGHTSTLFSKRVVPPSDPPLSKIAQQVGDDPETSDMRMLYKMLELGNSAVRFQIPNTAHNSFQGCCMTVSHNLSIRVVTPQGSVDPWVSAGVIVRTSHPDPETRALASDPSNNPFATVPAAWRPLIAPSFALPPMIIHLPIEPTTSGKIRPPTAGVGVVGGSMRQRQFKILLDAVVGSYTPCYELEKWLRTHSLDDMDENQAYALFHAVQCPTDQLEMAGLIANAREEIACVFVARTAEACHPDVRREVVEKLLKVGPVTDKENASLLKEHLTLFQFLTIEKYLL